ncbi:MAG: hypothetical protein Q9191_000480 [Dirinaria sp. TL-2023a]
MHKLIVLAITSVVSYLMSGLIDNSSLALCEHLTGQVLAYGTRAKACLELESSEQFEILPLFEKKNAAAPVDELSFLTLPMPPLSAKGDLSSLTEQWDSFFTALVWLSFLTPFLVLAVVLTKQLRHVSHLSNDDGTQESENDNPIAINELEPTKIAKNETSSYKDEGVQTDESTRPDSHLSNDDRTQESEDDNPSAINELEPTKFAKKETSSYKDEGVQTDESTKPDAHDYKDAGVQTDRSASQDDVVIPLVTEYAPPLSKSAQYYKRSRDRHRNALWDILDELEGTPRFKKELERCKSEAEENKKSYAKLYDVAKREKASAEKWACVAEVDLEDQRAYAFAEKDSLELEYDNLKQEKEDLEEQLASSQEQLRQALERIETLSSHEFSPVAGEDEKNDGDGTQEAGEPEPATCESKDQIPEPLASDVPQSPEPERQPSSEAITGPIEHSADELSKTSEQDSIASEHQSFFETITESLEDSTDQLSKVFEQDSIAPEHQSCSEANTGPLEDPADGLSEASGQGLIMDSPKEANENEVDEALEGSEPDEIIDSPAVKPTKTESRLQLAFLFFVHAYFLPTSFLLLFAFLFFFIRAWQQRKEEEIKTKETDEVSKELKPDKITGSSESETSETPSRLLTAFILLVHLYFVPTFYLLLFAFLFLFFVARQQRKEEERKRKEAEKAELEDLIHRFGRLSIRNKKSPSRKSRK